MLILNKKDKGKIFIELAKQGKTTRETGVDDHMSSIAILKILKEVSFSIILVDKNREYKNRHYENRGSNNRGIQSLFRYC